MVKLYVEGGGDVTALKATCREGFRTFITKAGIAKRPQIVACGSRHDAYKSFCIAVANNETAVLLVDSEAPVSEESQRGEDSTAWNPWHHLKHRPGDGWNKPAGSGDSDCHLMVQCMESWFIADRETLKTFFGQGFKENQLPPRNSSVESVDKTRVYEALANSTRDCKTKSPYGKGEHSFALLAKIDPAKVIAASAWARRFIDALHVKMESDGPA